MLIGGFYIWYLTFSRHDVALNVPLSPSGKDLQEVSPALELPLIQPSPSPFVQTTIPASTPTLLEHELMDQGTYPAGTTVEIPLTGPDSFGMSEEANPFLVKVDVTFIDPGGQPVVVPAFYDGDGFGGMDGNVWKVRFVPDVTGAWTFTSSSSVEQLDEHRGYFQVVSAAPCQGKEPADLRCKGQLDFNGSHYLRFKNGDYWIKGGVDDPENFLGTVFGGWQEKKEVIDYLAGQGVNSIYVITNNIDGDRRDTWPWAGSTPEEAKQNSNRFDTAKLALWEDFFSYAASKGIVLHIVLNDDSAWHDYDHVLYFREMIARFGHHPGLIWNLGEEANEIYSDDEQIELAQTLRSLDPYRHPVTIHRKANWPFIGNPHFDLTSIQAGDGAENFSVSRLLDYNQILIEHREKSASAGRPIPIMIDEIAGIDRVDESIRQKVRSMVLYPIYLGGGNFELHFSDAFVEDGLSSLRALDPLLEDMHRARLFLQSLPFHRMSSCNPIILSGEGICFGEPGQQYALYFPRGGTVLIDLSSLSGPVRVAWFDPRSGGIVKADPIQGGGDESFTSPDSGDWVLRLGG